MNTENELAGVIVAAENPLKEMLVNYVPRVRYGYGRRELG